VTERPQHDDPAAHRDAHGRPSDSAGQAWAGKSIPSHGFAGDTGDADPELIVLIEALAGMPSAAAGPGPDIRGADLLETDLMAHVARARWLVPVVAVASEVDDSGEQRVETRSDMAAVILTAPDGQRALPMFTSLASLGAWDPGARPVPVAAAAAARAAVGEECQVLVVDVGSPRTIALRPSMLWALAQERVLRAGLDGGDVQALATRIGERIATDGETRARIDALTIALETAR
jgi:hypothetical protein